jgi:hypothetical protein
VFVFSLNHLPLKGNLSFIIKLAWCPPRELPYEVQDRVIAYFIEKATRLQTNSFILPIISSTVTKPVKVKVNSDKPRDYTTWYTYIFIILHGGFR